MTGVGARLAGLTLAGLLVVAACGGDEGGDGGEGDTTGRPVTLTLLAYDSFVVSEGVLEAFTEETGIKVQTALGGDTGELVSKAILTKGRPEGDVLWGVDNTLLARALDEELFVPHRPAVDLPAELTALAPGGEVTPVDTGDVCVNYDKAWFQERGLAPPATLADLTDPAYADLLVVQNPATSSPGLAFLLATVAEFGEDGWVDYWEALRGNGVEVVDGWTEAYTVRFSGSSGQGPKPLVVSYGSSPPAEVVFAEPPVDEPPTGVVAATCFRQVEFAGILQGTEHEEEAGQLVDFLVSTTFQDDLPLSMFVYPVNPDATLPEVFERFAVRPADPLTLPPDVIAANRQEWIDEWTSTVLR